MNPERWQRITTIFEASLEREPSRRGDFITAACADDPSLVDDVQGLLRGHERTRDGVLDLAATDYLVASLPPGTRFGSYEIKEPIGAGGTAEVHRACDTRLGRDVAIKIL